MLAESALVPGEMLGSLSNGCTDFWSLLNQSITLFSPMPLLTVLSRPTEARISVSFFVFMVNVSDLKHW